MEKCKSNEVLLPGDYKFQTTGEVLHLRRPYLRGESLEKIQRSRIWGIQEFLEIAIKLVSKLDKIHRAGIVLRNISPHHIIIDPIDQSPSFIDWGISHSQHSHKKIYPLGWLAGNMLDPKYISPEQTGRLDTSLGVECDLYSIGIVFFEMLAGESPFTCEHLSQWIHAHLAVEPKSLLTLRLDCPEVIQEIILKLLSKDSVRRYQSAGGLLHDLTQCLHFCELEDSVPNFSLAQGDVSPKFQIPSTLYGREDLLQQLSAGFDRAKEGAFIIHALKGPSGVGKTTAVQGFVKKLESNSYIFLQGKYEQKKEFFRPFISAIEQFIQYIPLESEERTKEWKEQIQAILGESISFLLPVLPKLGVFLGIPVNRPTIEGKEYLIRFRSSLLQLIQLIAQKASPLVIFIDDIQWADSSFVEFVMHLAENKKTSHLLLLLAMRVEKSQEQKGGSNLQEFMRIPQVNLHHLDNLNLSEISELIRATIHCSKGESLTLGEILLTKTEGNPFYTRQFLLSLRANGYFWFSESGQKWEWDLQHIRSQAITENLAKLLKHTLRQLSEKRLFLLQVGSCIGNTFSAKQLAGYLSEKVDEISSSLTSLERELFLVRIPTPSSTVEELWGFAHEQIQKVVYQSILPKRCQEIHHALGVYLLSESTLSEGENDIYPIVEQFNKGVAGTLNLEERDQLIGLNFQAGIQSRKSAMYSLASTYFQTSFSYLPPEVSPQHYERDKELTIQILEIYFLIGDYENALIQGQKVLERYTEQDIRVRGYITLIKAVRAQRNYDLALHWGIEGLRELGVKFSKNDSLLLFQTVMELTQAKWTFLTVREKDLQPASPLIKHQKKAQRFQWAMEIMHLLSQVVYIAKPTLLPLFICKQFRYQLAHGNEELAPLIFSAYGVLEVGLWDNMKGGKRLGDLAIQMVEKNQSQSNKGTTIYSVHAFIYSWVRPLSECIAGLSDAITYCLNSGMWENGAYAMSVKLDLMRGNGTLLSEWLELSHSYRNKVKDLKQENPLYLMELENHLVQVLHTGTEFPDYSTPQPPGDNSKANRFIHGKYSAVQAYLFGQINKAFEEAKIASQYQQSALANFVLPEFLFYEGMIYCEVLYQQKSKERLRLRRKINKNIKRLKKWAKHAPGSIEFYFLLLHAEWMNTCGKREKSLPYFEKARLHAVSQGILPNQFLVFKRLGYFHHAQKNYFLAEVYFREAWEACTKWEAYYLANHFQNRLFQYLGALRTFSMDKPLIKEIPEKLLLESLDTQALMKASFAISKEMQLGPLLSTVMQIILENTGAEKALLIHQEEDTWGILAQKATNRPKNPPDKPNLFPLSKFPLTIVEHVQKTQKTVVLPDAEYDTQHLSDSYLQTQHPLSLLCFPLVHKGTVSAIVYLENNQISGAFTSRQIATLNLLSTQMAISIENASLYNTLEQKVKSRTQELSSQKEELANKNLQNELLLREIHHRVKNNLQVISSILNLQSDNVSDPRIQEAIAAGQQRVKSMALIHQNLYQQDNLGMIEMRSYLENLGQNLLSSFRVSTEKVEIVVNMETLEMVIDTAIFVGLIANELITNSLKYAFPNNEKGEIHITMKATPDQRVLFEIRDNGIGGPSDESDASFGSELIRLLVLQLKGELTIDTQKGRLTQIRFYI